MIKRFVSSALVVLTLTYSLLALVGCGMKHIEDTNGEDNFELQTITDDNICNMDIGAINVTESEDIIGETVTYKSNKFSGVHEVFYENIIQDRLEITVNHARVDAGNFKMVLCLDDVIVHTFALNEPTQTFIFEDVSGTVSLRIAGESANFRFDYCVW